MSAQKHGAYDFFSVEQNPLSTPANLADSPEPQIKALQYSSVAVARATLDNARGDGNFHPAYSLHPLATMTTVRAKKYVKGGFSLDIFLDTRTDSRI